MAGPRQSSLLEVGLGASGKVRSVGWACKRGHLVGTKIRQHKPATFSAVMALVEEFQDANDVAWYRGCGRAWYNLAPTIYRHPTKKSPEDLHSLEKEISLVFGQRSPPFVSQSFGGDWDRMFFMQHYGIPTRLLDWTESPFVALYFALTTCERHRSGKPSGDCAFWMLNPSKWNAGALSDITFPGGVLDYSRQQVKSYSPSVDLGERKNMPIMIYGTHNSPRIVAQRGMFALFGKSTTPMEKQFDETKDLPVGVLEKIVINKDHIDDIARSLFRKGISDSTVYPDLTGLSLELRRSFGF